MAGETRPPSPRLRRGSLRGRATLRAKTGGKGIRTPGLLIANETLYQLSYTPEIRLSAATVTAARDFSNEEVYQGIVVDIDFKNT